MADYDALGSKEKAAQNKRIDERLREPKKIAKDIQRRVARMLRTPACWLGKLATRDKGEAIRLADSLMVVAKHNIQNGNVDSMETVLKVCLFLHLCSDGFGRRDQLCLVAGAVGPSAVAVQHSRAHACGLRRTCEACDHQQGDVI